MPGMLDSIVCVTLMSPFSISSPHSAIAPSEETKPSCGMTQSIGNVSSSFVFEDRDALDARAAVDRLQLPECPQLHFAGRGERLHLIDRRLMGAKAVAPVDHHNGLGDPLKVHGPIERGVATAHDENALAAEDSGIEHAIVQPLVVPTVGVLERQLAGRKRANTAGDQYRPPRILVL